MRQHQFSDPALLKQALTHRSAGAVNNERLEFLGDGVLNFLIAAELFALYPNASEGDLSRARALLVRKETLAEIARDIDIGEDMSLGQGERKSGGRRRESIIADAVEALLGAVYLDAGIDACRDLIQVWYYDRLRNLPDAEDLKDAKTRLQEYLQGRGLELPDYQLIDARGADHAREFHVRVSHSGLGIEADATARSRRKAEQAAAAVMLGKIGKP